MVLSAVNEQLKVSVDFNRLSKSTTIKLLKLIE